MSGMAKGSIAFLVGVFVALCASPSEAINLQRVRHASGDGYTRIVIDVDGTANYRAAFANADPALGLPARFYVDFNGAGLPRRVLPDLTIGDSRVARVRVGQFDERTARVVMELSGPVTPNVFSLDNPARVVIDLEDPKGTPGTPVSASLPVFVASVPAAIVPAKTTARAPAPAPVARPIAQPVAKPIVKPAPAPVVARPAPKPAPAPVIVAASRPAPSLGPAVAISKPRPHRRWRIVVDPGHGGNDPGATGAKGQREKDLTLAVSLRLAEKLRRGLDADVVMTRKNDKTLTLAERKDVANRRDVDLFVSIHANASTNKQAHGIETYYLKNTNDRATLRLAKLENGTSSLIKGGDVSEDADLPFILSDMVQGSKEADSIALARRIQEELVSSVRPRYKGVRDLGVKQGPFFVLDGTHMPSVLVETGFISHSGEGSRMSTKSYQEALAEGIYRGIHSHLVDESVAGIY